MQNNTLQEATGVFARNHRRRAWKKAVSLLACIVVFCTTYALILPAITAEKTAYCGIEPHQHSLECYEALLICGQEEIGATIPEHTEDCAADEQRLICENEEPEHQHTEECYEKVNIDACATEASESVGHVHTEACYERNLICGKEEHAHTLRCYSDPEADVEASESWLQSMSAVELTGSYRSDLIAVAESQIGYTESSRNYIVLDDGETTKGYTRYGAWYGDPYGDWCAMFVSFCLHYANIPAERFPLEASCPRWVEKLQGEEYGLYAAAAEGYEPLVGDLIFFDHDGDGEANHVGLVAQRIEDEQGMLTGIRTIEGNADNQVEYLTYSIGDGTILGYAALPNDPAEKRGDRNSYDGNEQSADVAPTQSSGILPADAEQSGSVQEGTVQSVTPNGTVINVFDYWLIERDAQDSDEINGNKPSGGINSGHALKFTRDGVGDTTNRWTGNTTPRSGLVEKQLGSDGYPLLTQEAASNSGSEDTTAESLAYLFDPKMENPYKQTFRNVGGLLQIDEEGYYYYDSQRNFAELNETTKFFTLYNTWGVKHGGTSPDGQFFPFNKYAESKDHTSRSNEINHYFGLTMTSRFVQRYDGHTNASRRTSTIFNFAGDDDVWVFIDGVLVGDLGGIHDMSSLNIDFATGDVLINGAKATTLKEAFAAAGVDTTGDGWRENTFADNTYHTLKFYYLERGNVDSNMLLKYNLTAVPATKIYKVDQYSRLMPDVEFTAYKANESWEYDGNNPVYTGTTDEDGEMIFTDEDNMPYTLKELKDILGTHCVLKETDAPPGYRSVGAEIHLRISDTALWCDNTYESGVWAMVTLQVSAPTTLQMVNRPEAPEQSFYEFDSKTSNGTLFGVVVKRVGNAPISKRESWLPVSGNSKDGYVVHQATTDEEFIREAILVAQEKRSVFEMKQSGAMELHLTDLPGKITEYYYTLGSGEKEKAKFTTAYYWTSADSIDGATVDNTYRVNADALAPYAFDRTFGASVEVPNLCNRLLVQKYDENGSLVDGAIFALFKANENGTYVADDGTEATLVEGEYTTEVHFVDNSDTDNYTVITMKDGRKITSFEQRRTKSTVLQDTSGTCVFGIRTKRLEEGCYYLREVEAPLGYKINTTPVMVRVTEDAIYANAGTANDGVKVARGTGYISATLHKAASAGAIDNTLTWIYQKLRVSGESTSFAQAVPNALSDWEYAKNEDNLEIASYLRYTRTLQSIGTDRFLTNYVLDEENGRPAIAGTVRTHEQQLTTDVGWSYNEIYQDYDFGIEHLRETGSSANYTDLRETGDLSHLFSRSVYVRVTDEQIFSDLEISKTVTDAPQPDRDEFTFTVTVNGATKTYDCDVYNISDRSTPLRTEKISSGGTITLRNGQVAVVRNLPGRASYTVTETPVSLYNASYRIDDAAAVEGFEAGGTLNWEDGENGNRVSRVAFTNTYAASLDLTVRKYAAGTTTPLNNAKFVLHTVTENPTYYYSDGNWVALRDGETPEGLAYTTGADGRDGIIVFTGIPDGTYALRELAAPDGYCLLKKEIVITVTGGKVAVGDEANFTEDSVTVYNSTGYEMPAAGGTGVRRFAITGLLLTTAAGILLLYSKKKRGKEDDASS